MRTAIWIIIPVGLLVVVACVTVWVWAAWLGREIVEEELGWRG